MRNAHLLRQRLKILAWTVLLGAVAGVVYMPFVPMDETPSGIGWPHFAAQGALITLFCISAQLFVFDGPIGAPLRRMRFAAAVAIKWGILTLLIGAAFTLGSVLWFDRLLDTFNHQLDLVRDMLYASFVALLIQTGLEVRAIIGPRILRNLLLGRYHTPLQEERVFLFIDVVGSTRLAEEMGPEGAYELISRFFFDVAQITAAYGGETHRYIGDEVVVTWPFEEGVADGRCIACYFAIRDLIDRRAKRYKAQFCHRPAFRAGVHGGPVVAGACGDDKREIVYFGDTINVAARLQKKAKLADAGLVASRALMDHIDGYVTEPIDDDSVDGRIEGVAAVIVLAPGPG